MLPVIVQRMTGSFFMLKIALTTIILTLAPLTAFAECFGDHQQAMSCADGAVWDSETKSCIKVTG